MQNSANFQNAGVIDNLKVGQDVGGTLIPFFQSFVLAQLNEVPFRTRTSGNIFIKRGTQHHFAGHGSGNRHHQSFAGILHRTDAFTLVAEIIESKIKPSVPKGEVAQNTFGHAPRFEDRGTICRAIANMGRQDVRIEGLTPKQNVDILGASSDHLVLDAGSIELKPGDEVALALDYGALLSAMTSPYISKTYIATPGEKRFFMRRRSTSPRTLGFVS